MFLVNSRLGRFAAAAAGSGSDVPPPAAALLLPKLRSDYAEFLDHGSPDRLGMLYPPTCVGLRYGRARACLGVFPGSVGSAASPCDFVSRLGLARRADLPALRPTCFHGGVQNPACVPFSVAPSVVAVPRRYRNVRLLRIGYAFRPRLSSRLTLGGLALPRKPWAYGGGVSRAALVTHASILTPLRSTVGRPPASPRRGSSPTNEKFIPPLRRIA